jgi:hypothetical protein
MKTLQQKAIIREMMAYYYVNSILRASARIIDAPDARCNRICPSYWRVPWTAVLPAAATRVGKFPACQEEYR